MAADEAMPLAGQADSFRPRPAGGIDRFSPFPPIADYAFLSDCEVTALVAPSGAVEWMCLPQLDGPSVFGALLDRDPGRSGSARTKSTCRPTGATCRGPWSWRPAGTAVRAGSSSATAW